MADVFPSDVKPETAKRYLAVKQMLTPPMSSKITEGALAGVGMAIATLPIEGEKESAKWMSLRQAHFDLWLTAFNHIDTLIDPTFDLQDKKNIPKINVMPPGWTINSGASPDSIKEPALRDEYKRRIEENHKKTLKYNTQSFLQKIDADWSKMVTKEIQFLYDFGNKNDVPELTAAVEKTLTNPARKEKMKKLIADLVAERKKNATKSSDKVSTKLPAGKTSAMANKAP